MAPTIADLTERNKATLAEHTPIPTFGEIQAANGPLPTTLIVTCMDPRCIPERYFNLGVGEVVVHRNAGGNVRHALRDIGIVEELFHVAELAIVHHTDCGTLAFTEDQVRGGVKARVAREHWADVDRITFGANADLVESVKGDVAWVRAHPLISDRLKQGCQGFVFDIKTGEIEKVNV